MRNSSKLVALITVLSVVSACSGSNATTAPASTPSPAQSQSATAPTPAASSAAPATATPSPVVTNYPRKETLYTTGKQWGAPSTWNPVDPNAAMGVVGLQYETLFQYDPLKDVFTPWLAAKPAEWDAAKTTETITLRDGIKWQDGQALTAKDVVFTMNLAHLKAVGSNIWDYIDSATATSDTVVTIKFKANPNYQEWGFWSYNTAIVPEHVFTAFNNEQIFDNKNKNGIGSGPYKYLTSAEDRTVWVRDDGWWGKSALNLAMQPKYIVDLVNGGNNVALGKLLDGDIDLSNNYFPGIAKILAGPFGVTTYFDKAPYMLSGNTAWLVPNLTKKPLDDAKFRQALAWSINVNDIVNNDYGNIVQAANPTGLLPTWDKYIDKGLVDSKGFKYDKAKAKQILADAGYKDVNNDGFVENKDGSALKLTLIVPDGWSDWMEAENIIAKSAKEAGINVEAAHPAYDQVVDQRNNMKFDLVINNDVQIGSTPWVYMDYVFHLPLQSGAGKNRNFEGYKNDAAWALVQQLDKTPVDDLATMKSIMSKLQDYQLTDMPIIPMWYNGMWSQVSNKNWTNWPSDKGAHVLPATWNGYWQMGAINMLAQIKPVGS